MNEFWGKKELIWGGKTEILGKKMKYGVKLDLWLKKN